jgi:hypothetical protein
LTTEQKRTKKQRNEKRNKTPEPERKSEARERNFNRHPFSRSSHLGKFSGDFELGIEISTEKRVDEV